MRKAGIMDPRKIPAMDVRPTEMQYRIIRTLGGMIGPSSEALAMTPDANAGLYPSSFIMGMRKDPKEAVAATARPTMAPINRHVPTVTRARAPLTCPTKAFTKSVRSLRILPLTISCPVRMKKGTARRANPFIPWNMRCETSVNG